MIDEITSAKWQIMLRNYVIIIPQKFPVASSLDPFFRSYHSLLSFPHTFSLLIFFSIGICCIYLPALLLVEFSKMFICSWKSIPLIVTWLSIGITFLCYEFTCSCYNSQKWSLSTKRKFIFFLSTVYLLFSKKKPPAA